MTNNSFSILISIGGFTITKYAVCILFGACLAYLHGCYQFKKMGLDEHILSDYFLYVLLIGILGARIWYVLMSLDYYAYHLSEVVAIWQGGLAIQGGLFAGLLFSYYFFKKKNISFLDAGDAIMPGVLIAQACGRWGNFFNHEAYGSEVTLAFLQKLHLPQFIIEHMYINGAYHHPTFLYESLGNIIVFLVITFIIRKYIKIQGIPFACYFIGYGIVRFPVEALRTDSLMFMGLKMAQVISILFIIVGIVMIILCVRRNKNAIYQN